MAYSPLLLSSPRGKGEPTIVFPGFATGDEATLAIRSYLRFIGYDCIGWGLGRNEGNPMAVRDKCVDLLTKTSGYGQQRVNVIGWSLGGVIAREMARDCPALVRCVVTFATPLFGPRSSVVAGRYSKEELKEIDRAIAERQGRKIAAPILAFYSKNDGIINWRACVDPDPLVTNVESTSGHIGIGIDPTVWLRTAKFLADPKHASSS